MNTQPTPPTTSHPLVITAEDMTAAIAEGTASHLSQVMTGFARYQNAWWIAEVGRWLLVDDATLLEFLHAHHEAVLAMDALFTKEP